MPRYNDRYHEEGHVQRQVRDLRVGDRVDLHNNEHADPEGFRGVESNHPEFEFEFLTVASIEVESAECTRVDFDNYSCGFPPDHWIDVDGEQLEDLDEQTAPGK